MDFTEVVYRQRDFFRSGTTRPVDFRLRQLQRLQAGLKKHEANLLTALQKDLGKSPLQGYTTELGLLDAEIRHTTKNLRRWMSPRSRRIPWFSKPGHAWVQPEPLGITLIIGPWNYPLQLLLLPLVSAIAAGNCAVLKPSELAPYAAEAVTNLVRDTFEETQLAVVNGGPEVVGMLLQERFDKIFFTGSPRVGRLVAAAAAKHLTPVTLELGGKCPVILCKDCNIELAARRIAWGKFMNAGQTCVAPDYLLVERGSLEKVVAALKKALREFYGEDASKSSDYGRIINKHHFERLKSYLRSGTILYGGRNNLEDHFIEPTILGNISPDSEIMQEEIFGPILPLLEFDSLNDALALLQRRPIPLALYLFTNSRDTEARVLAETRSGGACLNDVASHILGSGLPFGGLGESGMGAYHGQTGFQTFSHHRSVLRRATWLDLSFRYPPQRISVAKVKRALDLLLRS